MFDLKPACRGMTEVVARIAEDRFDDATPCTEYSVADLIDHVDHVARGATALALGDGDALTAASGPVPVHLEADWPDVVAQHLAALRTAWDDPAPRRRGRRARLGPLERDVGQDRPHRLVVHGWDLARATGQPFDLPEPRLRVCLDHVAAFVPDAPVPELWGPAVEVAADASLLDHIVAITGRTP